MVPPYHYLFFMFTALFGLDSIIIGQQVSVEIDLEGRRATISYFQLRGQGSAMNEVEQDLKIIKDKSPTSGDLVGTSLETIRFIESDSGLNAIVNLKILNVEDFMADFWLRMDDTDSVMFMLLEQEVIRSSNGREFKEGEETLIKWPSQGLIDLSLELSRTDEFRQYLESYYGEMVKLSSKP